MRFLIDRCAGRRLADWLREQGHEVLESRERVPIPVTGSSCNGP